METIDIINLILGFFGSSAGIVLLVYLYRQAGKVVEKTETEIDDKIYEVLPSAIDFIVENFETGEAEEILQRFLRNLNKTDKDTRIIEKKAEKELNNIKK